MLSLRWTCGQDARNHRGLLDLKVVLLVPVAKASTFPNVFAKAAGAFGGKSNCIM